MSNFLENITGTRNKKLLRNENQNISEAYWTFDSKRAVILQVLLFEYLQLFSQTTRIYTLERT
jgi:hypothetical protein